jgi:hypothetical protein
MYTMTQLPPPAASQLPLLPGISKNTSTGGAVAPVHLTTDTLFDATGPRDEATTISHSRRPLRLLRAFPPLFHLTL